MGRPKGGRRSRTGARRRCVRRDGRRWRAGAPSSGSGRRSLADSRARTPRLRRVCHRRSGPWFRQAGGMRTFSPAPLSGRYLSFAEREEIAILRAQGRGVREIARQLGRSPSTISRELRRNAATRSGSSSIGPSTAQWHADRRAKRPEGRETRCAMTVLRDTSKSASPGGRRPDGTAMPGPARSAGSAGNMAVARTGVGRSHGAQSRSQTGCV